MPGISTKKSVKGWKKKERKKKRKTMKFESHGDTNYGIEIMTR